MLSCLLTLSAKRYVIMLMTYDVCLNRLRSAADEGELLDNDVLSLTSSDPSASALLALSPREQEVAVEEEEGEPSETSRRPCPAYAELLEVMECASGRLQPPWEHVKKGTARGQLDERFPSDHGAAPVSLPFLPDLHVEIEKAWKNPYSARNHRHQRANFADVEGMSQHGRWCESSERRRHTWQRLKPAYCSDPILGPDRQEVLACPDSRIGGASYNQPGPMIVFLMACLQAWRAIALSGLKEP
ncbi:hypothetical protein DPX16_0969 [Anabarilius grahami]|uniref:Uncharacterized protein n=1 Tax=Anabarilius grahami TaxID=495550 RepID=A0A3N0YHH4_ANAGA|nr:hypothetical protein DPX16_0969 [Anabarilius grahami]